MNNPLVLTFDCGTQSLRALLIDQAGQVVGRVQHKYARAYHSVQPGWTEQSAEVYLNAMVDASTQLKAQCPELWEHIICVTVSTIRDTYSCIDKDGNILRDFIVWLDQRRAVCQEPLPFTSRAAFRLVGMTEALKIQRQITKSNWIKENEKDIWDKTYKYISVSTWLIYNLTGKLIDSTASQIGHIPFDYKHRTWKSVKDIQFPMFGVEKEKLCDLVEPGQTLGYITKAAETLLGIAEGTPVIATGSDKGCETLGVGVDDTSAAALSFGTAATVQICTDKYVEPLPLLPAYPAVRAGKFNPEIQIYRGYWMVSWFLREFAEKEVVKAKELGCSPEQLLNEELSKVNPGCDGLLLQPYWSPMLKEPEGKGSIIGFSSEHTRIHIYRAIIEGVGFALRDGLLNLIRRSGNKITWLAVGGGGSQSDAICQITADIFNLPVRRVQTYDATALGSSMVAFVSCGVYSDIGEAKKNMVHTAKEFVPNKEAHAVYDKLFRDVYRKTYAQLRPLYRKIYTILKDYE